MKWLAFVSMVIMTGQSLQGVDSDPAQGQQNASATQSPVLRKSEPSDNVVFRLPGPAPAPPVASATLPTTEVRPAPPPDPDRPVLRRPKREYPPDFERDSADFLGQQIGIWQQVEAQALLGSPSRQRSALGD